MRNKIIIYFITLILFSLNALGGEIESADSAYNSKNYEEAVKLYNRIIEREGVSAGILYNLGNAYYKLGNDAEAVVCYERAIKIESGNEMIKQNLNFLRTKINDANRGSLEGKAGNIEPQSETILDTIYRKIAIERQSNGWAVFAVMAFILFLGGISMYIFTPNVLARKTGFFSAITFLIFTVIFIIFGFLAASQANKQDEAVLLNFTTTLLESPNISAQSVSSPLHKGTKLKIIETETSADGNQWIKVMLNNDNVGWVKSEDIKII